MNQCISVLIEKLCITILFHELEDIRRCAIFNLLKD